jgi:hypothetical protein
MEDKYMNNNLSVLTPAEVAAILKVPEEAVFAELEAGRLKGFRVGSEWRTTYDFVREMVSSPTNIPPAVVASASPPPASGASTVLPEKADSLMKGVPKLEQFKQMSWQEIGGFSHQWPHGASEAEGTNLETYEKGYAGVITIEGKETSFVIGMGKRPAAGMDDRARLVVFKGKPGRTLYPLVEFVGANDFDTSGRLVSIIRREGRKPVRPGESLPAAYDGMPTGIYNELVVGPRAWNVCAVVANATDFPVMVRHAVLRDRRLG